jgi:hypothetical protein
MVSAPGRGGIIMTSTHSTINRLPLAALTAAVLSVGVAGTAFAATPPAAPSSTSDSTTGGTADTQVSKTLTGKAKIIDGKYEIAPGLLIHPQGV